MGEWNVGQLARDRYGHDAVLVGFSTYNGWVTAASDWDEPHRRKRVRDGLEGSWEDVFHRCGMERSVLVLRGNEMVRALTMPERLQRAIGVIYRPETERHSHYFQTRLADQFDVMIHIDETQALEPLDRGEQHAQEPETYPSGV
jgi:erythromycin esterase-like protein